ncbi:hypothetical protein EMIT079MI2_160034 [Bacillus sp. IT-79MI2]
MSIDLWYIPGGGDGVVHDSLCYANKLAKDILFGEEFDEKPEE